MAPSVLHRWFQADWFKSDYLTAFLLVNEVDGGGRPASGVGNINLLLQLDTDEAHNTSLLPLDLLPTEPPLAYIVNCQVITSQPVNLLIWKHQYFIADRH